MPVKNWPINDKIVMSLFIPKINREIPIIWIPKEKIKENRRPFASANAGRPNIPIKAPKA